ncbi:MAG: HNH endonuclease [Bacteroidia bacterium]
MANRVWVLKSVPDEDRSYVSEGNYNDELSKRYVYDNFVPNYKQLRVGDLAVIIDKEIILGFAKVEDINSVAGKKNRRRCPECETTNFEARKQKTPRYRCNNGHVFSEYSSELIDSINYTASYENFYIKAEEKISISQLRPFYINNYNRNMSIQFLDWTFLSKNHSNVLQLLLNSNDKHILPTDALEGNLDIDLVYIPNSLDERKVADTQIRIRRGQKKFRDGLRKRYGDKCMITGCELLDVLEAAHINPYLGEKDNNLSNGLLLRTDIHTLFDLDLIGIEPDTLMIHVHGSAYRNGYERYHGRILQGWKEGIRPSKKALNQKWKNFTPNIVIG